MLWLLFSIYGAEHELRSSRLRQRPFLERSTLSESAKLPLPNFPKENHADVGAAQMLLRPIGDDSLASLGNVVLRVNERNLVVRKLLEIFKIQLTRQNRLACVGNRKVFLRKQFVPAFSILPRRLSGQRHQP